MSKSVQLVLLFLVALFLGGLTYYLLDNNGIFFSDPPVQANGSGLPKTEPEFRNKIAEFRMQKEKIQRGVDRLEKLKQETLDHLKKKGITSSADVDPNDSDVLFALRNLKARKTEIEKLEKDIASYDQAIVQIENMLVKIKAKNINDAATISEDEYLELQKVIVDLNERLNPETDDIFEQEELGKLLDEEMK